MHTYLWLCHMFFFIIIIGVEWVLECFVILVILSGFEAALEQLVEYLNGFCMLYVALNFNVF